MQIISIFANSWFSTVSAKHILLEWTQQARTPNNDRVNGVNIGPAFK